VQSKEDDDVDTPEFARLVVYRNLQKEYSLKSWAQEIVAMTAKRKHASLLIDSPWR
jgi:hypothetical protein